MSNRSSKAQGRKTTKTEGKKSRKTPPTPSNRLRWLRGVFGLVVILGGITLLGSFFMRVEVIDRVKRRMLTSSSLLYSRPYTLSRQVNIKVGRLAERAKRLGYRKVTQRPVKPGQFSFNNDRAYIYLKEAKLGNGVHDLRPFNVPSWTRRRSRSGNVAVSFGRSRN